MPCPLVGCKMCITPTWVALQCKNTWEHTQQWWWVGICIKYKKCKCRTQANAQCKSTLPGRGGLQSVPINSSSRAPSTLSSHLARCMFLSFSHQTFWRLWLCRENFFYFYFLSSLIFIESTQFQCQLCYWAHGTSTCIKRKKITYGNFLIFVH